MTNTENVTERKAAAEANLCAQNYEENLHTRTGTAKAILTTSSSACMILIRGCISHHNKLRLDQLRASLGKDILKQ
jgi:hypothetical protein